MQKSNEDCFYFLTASCAKGASCTYRHNPSVLACNVICPGWSRGGNCVDPACPLRHSTVQRPTVSNGILCFYENAPMGCLKPDCTFAHSRPRPNSRNSSTVRPSTTNLVNKDAIKPTIINPPISTPQIINDSVPSPQINSPVAKIETPTSSSIVPNEIVPRRLTVPLETEQSNEKTESPTSIKKNPDETKTINQSRLVGNRNIVIAESSTRKVVHGTTNRVVVPSDTISKKITHDSDSDLDDLIEQENDSKNMNTLIDISFPCSAPSILNRIFTSSKQSPSTNDTKPIRLNRDRLPATKISSGNSTNSVSTSSNEEKSSPGTELSQDNDRRTSRLERFKKTPNSPPRSIICSSSSTPPINSSISRNVITSSPNERKRPAPEQQINDSPPLKRLSTTSSQQENNHHHNTATIGDLCSPPSSSRRTHNYHHRRRRRSSSQRTSPSRPTASSLNLSIPSSSMKDSDWKNEVDKFLAKTTQPKMPLFPTTIPPQPVPLLSLRPRYIPPQQLVAPRRYPPPPPPPVQPTRIQRPRQPTPVAIRQPLTQVTTPQLPAKPIEPSLPDNVPLVQSSTIQDDEDENLLLELDESTDVVDTFALIDEALFEADHFLELM